MTKKHCRFIIIFLIDNKLKQSQLRLPWTVYLLLITALGWPAVKYKQFSYLFTVSWFGTHEGNQSLTSEFAIFL